MKVVKISIDPFFRDILPPLSKEELGNLERSLLKQGCVQPLVVWKETGILVDGCHRHSLCHKHGISYEITEESFNSKESAELWVIQSQLGRRNITPYHRVVLALKYEKVFRRRAKQGQGARTDLRIKKDGSAPVSAMAEVGKVALVSRDTAYKVKKIKEHATREVKKQVADGEITIHAAYRMAFKEEHRKNLRVTPLPKGKYDIIYADPPWHYHQDGMQSCRVATFRHYPSMTDEELFSIPVDSLSHSDSAFFLWVTTAKLDTGLRLLEHYGFSYKATWSWDKDIANSPNKAPNAGFWHKTTHEILLLGIKGTFYAPAPESRW